MTESVAGGPLSAGSLIRTEREKQGIHIAALAAAIKVAPRKLDALENDRWSELPDATFTRALAQTVCRSLKLDSRPVLERLPAVEAFPLDTRPGGLNAPFNDRGSSSHGTAALVGAIRPMAWAGVVLMVAAVALYVFPPSWLPDMAAPESRPGVAWPAAEVAAVAALAVPTSTAGQAAAQQASAASQPLLALSASTPVAAVDAAVLANALGVPQSPFPAAPLPAAIVEPPSVLMAASLPQPQPQPGLVQLRASADSWVEARDGGGRVLLSRMVASGEALGIDGALPIRLTIGNARATTLAFRGQPVDLQARSRDNVARLELQ